MWHGEHATRPRRLRFYERQLTTCTLDGTLNAQHLIVCANSSVTARGRKAGFGAGPC
jgi:hypothetical protein